MRWAAAAWLAVWIPAYASVWGPRNFLLLCDVAVLLTCGGGPAPGGSASLPAGCILSALPPRAFGDIRTPAGPLVCYAVVHAPLRSLLWGRRENRRIAPARRGDPDGTLDRSRGPHQR